MLPVGPTIRPSLPLSPSVAPQRSSLEAAPSPDLCAALALRTTRVADGVILLCEPAHRSFQNVEELSSLLNARLEVMVGDKSYKMGEAVPFGAAEHGECSVRLGAVELAKLLVSPERIDVAVIRPLTSLDLRQLSRLGDSDEALTRYIESMSKVCAIEQLSARRIDIHTHFAGELKAERLVELAIEHDSKISAKQIAQWGLPVVSDSSLLEADARGVQRIGLSTYLQHLSQTAGAQAMELARSTVENRLHIPAASVIPFRELSQIYDQREFICQDPKMFRALVREIGKQYQSLGVEYAELSLSPITNPRFLRVAHEELPKIEEEMGVRIRFLAGLRRTEAPENMQQLVDLVKFVASRSPYVVGVDFMGHETNSTREFSAALKAIAAFRKEVRPDFQIRVHAGENARYAANVIDAIELGATRIGHGLRGVDDRVYQKAREKSVVIELNLNSNSALNNLIGTNLPEEVVIGKYLEHGVRVTLGSDGAGVYQAGGRQETYAAIMCGLSDAQLRAIDASDAKYISDQRGGELRVRELLLQQGPVDDAWFESIPAYKPTSERARQTEHLAGIKTTLQSLGVELLDTTSNPDQGTGSANKLDRYLNGRPAIVFSGAAKTFSELEPEAQAHVESTVSAFFEHIVTSGTAKDVVIVTGGTHVGVEALVHTNARKHGVPVLGALSESTSGKIEKDTITHAFLAGRNWYDALPEQIRLAQLSGGAMIFVGGGDIVKDAIQGAHNEGTAFVLLDGVPGASTDKIPVYPTAAVRNAQEMAEFVDDRSRVRKTVTGRAIDNGLNLSRGALLAGVFEDNDPQIVFSRLKRADTLATLYALPNEARGTYTVGQHSEAVFTQLHKYPFAETLTNTDLVMLRALVAFHDLEKIPLKGMRLSEDVRDEHERAEKWLRSYAPKVGLPDNDVEVAVALLHSEVLGDLFKKIAPARYSSDMKVQLRSALEEASPAQRPALRDEFVKHMYQRAHGSVVSGEEYSRIIDASAQALINQARECNVPPDRYMRLAVAFYQSDCSSYTTDNGTATESPIGNLSMDFLFALADGRRLGDGKPVFRFDSERGRIAMRGVFEKTLQDVEKAVAREAVLTGTVKAQMDSITP